MSFWIVTRTVFFLFARKRDFKQPLNDKEKCFVLKIYSHISKQSIGLLLTTRPEHKPKHIDTVHTQVDRNKKGKDIKQSAYLKGKPTDIKKHVSTTTRQNFVQHVNMWSVIPGRISRTRIYKTNKAIACVASFLEKSCKNGVTLDIQQVQLASLVTFLPKSR